MGGLLKGPDDPQRIDIDPEAQGIINDRLNSSKADPGPDIGLMTAEANIAHGPQSSAQSSAASGSDPAYTQALHNQYYGKAKKDIDSLKSQSGIQGQMDKANKLKNASALAIGQEQAKMAQYQFLTNAYNQQEQSKASAINQLFQLGAYGMGQYYGNQRPGGLNYSDSISARTSGGQQMTRPGEIGQF